MIKRLKDIVPLLLDTTQKGYNGKVAVIGGCTEYTGAPYFSAISALYGGADIAHIFCTKNASIPIKSYSPEVIVHSILFTSEDIQIHDFELQKQKMLQSIIHEVSNLNGIIIGPGIGRDKFMQDYMADILKQVIQQDQIVVLDADGIWYLTDGSRQRMEKIVLDNSKNIVLTPNNKEFTRIWHTFMKKEMKFKLLQRNEMIKKMWNEGDCIIQLDINDDIAVDAVALACKLGNINILHKGQADIVTNGQLAFMVKNRGSSKRCGGLGDMLAGLTGLYSYWGSKCQKLQQGEQGEGILLGCVLASYIMRDASKKAYDKYLFAMTAPNIIDKIGTSFHEFKKL